MRCWTDYFVKDFGGGPRSWKLAWVINFQKTGTFPILAFLIAWYHNTSTAAWIYLAMHGSYGLVWIIKDLAFPEATWQPSLVQKLKEFCFILEQKIQTSINSVFCCNREVFSKQIAHRRLLKPYLMKAPLTARIQ